MSELQFNFPFSFTIYLNLWNPFYLPEARTEKGTLLGKRLPAE